MVSKTKYCTNPSGANRELLLSLLDSILPAYCTLCGLESGSGRLCTACLAELPRLAHACRQCALPGLYADAQVCGVCLHKAPQWEQALAALVYEYPVDRMVWQFKFQRSLACGQLLADELIHRVKLSGTSLPDILVPVPLHFTRRFWRGFNQAEFLAHQLGARLTIPVVVDKLQRKKRTPAQSGLDRKQRQRNIHEAFSCIRLGNVTVALVDDVLTTGTTLTACTRAVKAAGASHVAVWVAARVDDRPIRARDRRARAYLSR